MEKENIIEKIKKLLALADGNKNASEAEVQAATLKAQELMAKYDVQVELTEEDKIEYAQEVCTHKWDMGFRIPLANALSHNFKCEIFIWNKRITFVGHSVDAKIARGVFEMAYAFILKEGNKHYNKAYGMGLPTKGVFNSYAMGFIKGITIALGEQSTALMIVTPPDVTQELKRITAAPGFRTKNSTFGTTEMDAATFFQGLNDGKNMLSKKQINA